MTASGPGEPTSRTRRDLVRRMASARSHPPGPFGAPGRDDAQVRLPVPEDARGLGPLAAFYDAVSESLDRLPSGSLSQFLNLGYLDGDGDRSSVPLPPNTLDRCSVKLILELVANVELAGLDVLDVGSGRGGTVATLLSYLQPASVAGLELSARATAFSRRSVPDPRAHFVVGDAQRMPFADDTFSVVTNVESSHCYPDLPRFYTEVRRVLRRGGWFLYSDLLPRDSLTARRDQLAHRDLTVKSERDITANVLAACDLIADRRKRSFASAEDATLQNFLAAPGSPTYDALTSGETVFFIWQLRATA